MILGDCLSGKQEDVKYLPVEVPVEDRRVHSQQRLAQFIIAHNITVAHLKTLILYFMTKLLKLL